MRWKVAINSGKRERKRQGRDLRPVLRSGIPGHLPRKGVGRVLRSGFICILIIVVMICVAAPVLADEPLRVSIEGLEGVEGDALDNAEAALAIPTGLVREGKVDELWLRLFVKQTAEKVRNALEPFGYYKAQVTTTLEKPADGNYLLRVKVEPGEPVVVTSVRVDLHGPGAKEQDLLDLAREFPLQEGDVLLQSDYESAKNSLKSRALGLGFLDADFSVHEILISRDRTGARIDLELDTGPQYRFGETSLTGAPEYPEKFLRRYLAFKPGEIYSPAKINNTQLNYINAERFRAVIVTPEREKTHDLQVPVLVSLKPSPRRRLRVGGGYGTDTGARFTGRYKDVNMFQLGHELQLELFVAQRLQGLGAGYMIPSSRDVNSSTGLQLNLQREDVSTYTSQLISAQVNRNRSFGPGKLGTAYLELLQEDFTVGAQKSSSRLVLPGLRFTDRRYDDLIRPTRGYRYTLEVRGTHQFLGSDTGLIQFIADGNVIVPMPWRLTLFTRGKLGMTAQNDPLSDLPPSIRFFAGGDTSVRGYSYQSLGPRDASGNVAGGKDLVVGSIEVQRDIFKKWGVSVFFDTGNAFDSFTNIRLFSGTGIGIHYYTLIGSINLYFARQIGVPSPGNHIHFTMGFNL
jgi:translocation and assembly module TamA